MSGNLCEHCAGMCCRYLALPIDLPEDRGEFDDIRWYLLHEGVSVFVEDGEWYLHITTDCRHLLPDYRCGLYQTRPRICRDYTTENCDYHSGEYGWEQHFTCPEHLDEYVRNVFAKQPKDRRAAKRASNSKRTTKRPRVQIKRRPRSPAKPKPGYADATSDIRGTPLPSLEVER